MRRIKPRVGIVGAGVMGLACALDILEAGYDVVVFEAAKTPGGLAGSFPFGPERAEKFYHFICGSDRVYFRWLRRLGLADRLRWRRTTMAVFRDEGLLSFGTPAALLGFSPLTPLSRLRYGFHMLKAKRLNDWRPLEGVRATDWLVDGGGEQAYRIIWEPLLRHKFGDSLEDLSAAWIWSRIHRLASSRDRFFRESLGFVEGGTDVFIEALADAVRGSGGQIRCDDGVEELLIDGDRVGGVRASGVEHTLDGLLSTAPLPVLERLGKNLPPDYRQAMIALPNIGVRCIVLKLRAPLSSHFWINVNDDDVPICGLIELTNLHQPESLNHHHLVYSPHYVSAGHPEYSRPDDEILEETLSSIERVQPGFDRSSVVDFRVFRAPYAQPVCPIDFTSRLAPIRAPLHNLVAGDTSHLLPHDRSISDSLALAERLTGALRKALEPRTSMDPRLVPKVMSRGDVVSPQGPTLGE